MRLLVTNSGAETFHDQCRFFRSKLLLRGYPSKLIDSVFAKYPFRSKESILAARSKNTDHIIVPFRVIFSRGIDTVAISEVLRARFDLLDEDLRNKLRVLTAYRTGKNLFRNDTRNTLPHDVVPCPS